MGWEGDSRGGSVVLSAHVSNQNISIATVWDCISVVVVFLVDVPTKRIKNVPDHSTAECSAGEHAQLMSIVRNGLDS